MLKVWKSGMPISWEVFETVPVSVCLPDLDPLYYTRRMLGKLGSAIGKPICPDNITATSERMSYARILVEVSAVEVQRREIEIEQVDGTIVK